MFHPNESRSDSCNATTTNHSTYRGGWCRRNCLCRNRGRSCRTCFRDHRCNPNRFPIRDDNHDGPGLQLPISIESRRRIDCRRIGSHHIAPYRIDPYHIDFARRGIHCHLIDRCHTGCWPIYHPIYHPFNWRGWVDWGCGAIGDMGAHLIDHPYWALDLGLPTTVETVATPFRANDTPACYPMATTTYYELPARGSNPAVKRRRPEPSTR